jgi:hypothetical protein
MGFFCLEMPQDFLFNVQMYFTICIILSIPRMLYVIQLSDRNVTLYTLSDS